MDVGVALRSVVSGDRQEKSKSCKKTQRRLDTEQRFLAEVSLIGDGIEDGLLTHPILDSSAPAMTAPSETPAVIPVFTSPMKSPRRSGLVIWIVIILATMKIPLAPAPEMTRPMMNISNVFDVATTSVPAAMRMVEKNMQSLGLKT